MHLKSSLLALFFVSTTALAGGFGVEGSEPKDGMSARDRELSALVGRTVYYRSEGGCMPSFFVRKEPNRFGTKTYTTIEPVNLTFKVYEPKGAYETVGDMRQYFVVEMEDGTTGYVDAENFPIHRIGTDYKSLQIDYCVSVYHPKELSDYVAAEKERQKKESDALHAEYVKSQARVDQLIAENNAYRAALRKKPGASIGMTAKQVLNNTSWGQPNKVNRTTTASGVDEQWVYGGGNYLYFRNGVLRSIQN